MPACVFQFRLPGRLALLLALAGVARAETGLGITSPFLPAGNAPAAITTNGPIELHGVMVTPAGTRFSIYNTTSKKATWVGMNETGNPFVVRSHRIVGGDTDQVTVDYQGSPVVLALKQPKIGAVTQAVAPVAGLFSSVVVAPAVQGTPPNLPAGASLDEWAAEVQRRRELRQQPAPPQSGAAAPASGQQPAQGGPPPAGSRG